MITKVIENIDLASLDTLSVKGCVNVKIIQGDNPSLTIEVNQGDELENLSIQRKGH